MKVIIVSLITGITASLLMILFMLIRKKNGFRLTEGASGMAIFAAYGIAHVILSGIPPVSERGFNIPTEQWNLIILVLYLFFFLLPEFNGGRKILRHLLRFVYASTAAFLVLQVPYINTLWSFPLALGVIILISIVTSAGLNETDRIAAYEDNFTLLTTLGTFSLTVTLILGVSGTITLSVLSGQVFAALTAMAVVYYLSGKILQEREDPYFGGAAGFVYILSLFFLIEGYFFAYVPIVAVILPLLSLFSLKLVSLIFPGQAGKLTGKKGIAKILVPQMGNIIAVLFAVVTNR